MDLLNECYDSSSSECFSMSPTNSALGGKRHDDDTCDFLRNQQQTRKRKHTTDDDVQKNNKNNKTTNDQNLNIEDRVMESADNSSNTKSMVDSYSYSNHSILKQIFTKHRDVILLDRPILQTKKITNTDNNSSKVPNVLLSYTSRDRNQGNSMNDIEYNSLFVRNQPHISGNWAARVYISLTPTKTNNTTKELPKSTFNDYVWKNQNQESSQKFQLLARHEIMQFYNYCCWNMQRCKNEYSSVSYHDNGDVHNNNHPYCTSPIDENDNDHNHNPKLQLQQQQPLVIMPHLPLRMKERNKHKNTASTCDSDSDDSHTSHHSHDDNDHYSTSSNISNDDDEHHPHHNENENSMNKMIHISLTRTFYIQRQSINSFLSELKKHVRTIAPFPISFPYYRYSQNSHSKNTNISIHNECSDYNPSMSTLVSKFDSQILTNDDQTRSFLTVLEASSSSFSSSPSSTISTHNNCNTNNNKSNKKQPIQHLIQTIDKVMVKFGLPTYYEKPIIHLSLASFCCCTNPVSSTGNTTTDNSHNLSKTANRNSDDDGNDLFCMYNTNTKDEDAILDSVSFMVHEIYCDFGSNIKHVIPLAL